LQNQNEQLNEKVITLNSLLDTQNSKLSSVDLFENKMKEIKSALFAKEKECLKKGSNIVQLELKISELKQIIA